MAGITVSAGGEHGVPAGEQGTGQPGAHAFPSVDARGAAGFQFGSHNRQYNYF
jgi:hypothetical protein